MKWPIGKNFFEFWDATTTNLYYLHLHLHAQKHVDNTMYVHVTITYTILCNFFWIHLEFMVSKKYYFNTFSKNNMKNALNIKIKIEIDTSNDEQLKTISELTREIKRGRKYY